MHIPVTIMAETIHNIEKEVENHGRDKEATVPPDVKPSRSKY